MSGPVIYYRNRSFSTEVLGICKMIHDEALSILLEQIHSTLSIYLLYNGCRAVRI